MSIHVGSSIKHDRRYLSRIAVLPSVYIAATAASNTELLKVSEYEQEIPQSHTADQPTAPRGRATEHL